jgi:hypothetical protein|tara:strand:- start:7043 stop:7237 length:195 start_codon:yes stop_codon:yes gene_type:complete
MASITSSLSLSAKAAVSGRKVTLGGKRGAFHARKTTSCPFPDRIPDFPHRQNALVVETPLLGSW